jgi:hypothetical protein
MSGDNGRAAVVAEAVNGVGDVIARARAAADGEQLALLEAPATRGELGRSAGELAEELGRRRSRGRPPGAVNKSNAALREYLLARGVNPLQRLMEWALHDPDTLAIELGCTRLEAFRELRAVWEGLAPYFMAKMVPVDDQGRPVPVMLMQFGQFGAPREAGGKAPWLYLESEQNQPLSAAADPVSDGAVSDGAEKGR